MYLRQRCFDGSVNKTIVKPRFAVAANRVKGCNSGTLSYFSNFAYNSGFMQHRYGALASSIILL